MADNDESRPKKERSQKKKIKRLVIIFLIVLLVGAGFGVGMNLLFGKDPVEKIAEDTTDREEAERADENGSGDEEEEHSGRDAEASDSFSITRAMEHCYELSERIGERPAGSVRASSAADYIVRVLGEMGYTVEEQPFTMQDGFGSRNIIATSRGTRDGFTLVVGAHYDGPRGTPGALNNATGVGVVLELARVFMGARLEPTIKFVFLGANKPGGDTLDDRLEGSRAFVKMLGSFEKKELVGMISVDRVGQGQVLALRTQGTGLQRLKAKLDTFAREQDVEHQLMESADDSDNIPFEDGGVPAVWIEWCDADGGLQTDDTYTSVVPEKLRTVGQLVESFLVDLTPDDLEELKY